jgi:hypothetical protein
LLDRLLGFVKRHHVALLALFVVLGGSAYAARQGKIGSKRIKTDAVKERHIAANAVGDSEAAEASFGVIRGQRINIDDPAGGGATTKTIFKYGPFTITGSCTDNSPNYVLQATISSSQTAFASGTTDTTDPDTIGTTPSDIAPTFVSGPANSVTSRGVTAFTAGGTYISVGIFGVRRPQNDATSDCAFWVSGQARN